MLTCKVLGIYAIVIICMNNKQVPDEQDVAVASDDLNKLPSGRRELLSTLGILLTAIVVAFLIITFVFRSYQVDGTSMLNTLQNGDKLIIWKVPRTWARVTGHPYIPKRGDIIVFTETGLAQYGQQNTKQLIKRVIGLPGDRVVVKNGEYTIYNAAHPHGFDPDKTLAYGKDDAIPYTSGNINIKLGPDQLFVSGDNRPDSLDSRYFGPINANQIIGQLVIRVFPINHTKTF
jgi:signal peptidase I